MRAILFLAMAMAMMSSMSLAAGRPEALTLFTWEDYLDQDVIDQWEAETSIPIKQVYFDNEGQRNLVLASASAGQIDLVVVDSSSIDVLGSGGLLHPVTKETNTSLYWPNSCSSYGRQYLWGTYGIVYRQDKIATPITSWKDIMHPSEALKGHVGMLGQEDELLTTALAALGYPIDSKDGQQLKEAFELLKQQSPYVMTYDYIYTYVVSKPEQEDVWIAPAYSGDQDGLNLVQGKDVWQYVVPEEGSIVWIDCMSIASKSGHKVEAQRFIDFLSQIDISAKNSASLWVASPYREATTLQSDEFKQSESVYLTEKELAKAKLFSKLNGADILTRTRIKDALIRYHDSN